MTGATDLTDDQAEAVIGRLCDGFGVEDIALIEGIAVNDVRAFVRSISPSLLKEIYLRAPD